MSSVTNLWRTTALLSLVTTITSVTSWDTTPKSKNSSTLIERLTSWDTTPKSNNSSTLIERLTSWDTTPKSNNSSTLIERLTSWDTTPKSNNSSTLIERLTSWDTTSKSNNSSTLIERLTSWDTTPKSNNSSTLIERLTSWDTTPKSNNSSTLIKRLTSWGTTPKSNNSSTLIERLTSWDTTPKSNNSSTLIERLTRPVNRVVGENFDNNPRRLLNSNKKFRTDLEDLKIKQKLLANNDKSYHDYFNQNFLPQNTFKCPPCVCKNVSSSSVSVFCKDCSTMSIPQNWPVEINEIIIEACVELKVLDLSTLLMYTSLTHVKILTCRMVKVLSSSHLNASFTIIDLALDYNDISIVEENCFCILPNLLKLSLSYNKIKSLTKAIFTGLRSLSHLSVAGNSITFIANDTFDDMGNLVTLDISSNYLLSAHYDLLPVRIFVHLKNLQELYMNQVCQSVLYLCESYPNKALKVLTNLRLLYIDGLYGEGLGPEIKSLKHLTHLIVEYPQSYISRYQSYFKNVPFLTTLEILFSDNRYSLKALGNLANLVNFTYYSAKNNKEDVCRVLIDIKYLLKSSLKYLTLKQINSPYTGCKGLEQLQAVYIKQLNVFELDLSGNYLRYLSRAFLETLPDSLKKIDLSKNSLSHMLFLYFPIFPKELLEINLNNQFTEGPDNEDIGKRLKANTELKSNHSLIATLKTSASSFEIQDLETLKILKALPAQLQILRADYFKGFGEVMWAHVDPFPNYSLKVLSLAGSEFHHWASGFCMNSIEMADFSNNSAKEYSPSFFHENNSLKYFWMSNNNFGSYLEYNTEFFFFSNTRQLIAINISRNDITVIPSDYFRDLIKVQIVDMSKNKIQSINIRLSHMTDIKFLDFSSNSITSISKQSRDDLDIIAADHRVYLDLTSNPLLCTCEGLELMKWMASTNVYLLNQDFLTCRNEFHEVLEIGNIVQRVEKLQRQCASKTVIILTCVFSIIVFVILLITSLMYRYRWKLRYLRSIALVKLLGARPAATNMVGYRFDAYMLYTDDTRRFVLRDCVRELEEKRGHQLCIEDRDFIPGIYNVSQIVSSVQNSTKTVAMVTPEFYEGEYSEYSVKMALMEEIFMRRSVLFLCVCEPTDDEDLSHDLLTAMKQNNYIEYPPRDDVTEEIIDEFWDQFSRAIGRNEREEI